MGAVVVAGATAELLAWIKRLKGKDFSNEICRNEDKMIRFVKNMCAKCGGATSAVLAVILLIASVGLSGCGPTYPNCANDDTCKSKGEFCVNNKCAQCRVDANCPGAANDACAVCTAGACGRKADCCTNKMDCGNGKKCDANKCVAECGADTDCPAGAKCTNGACMLPQGAGTAAAGAGCAKDGDCGAGLKCSDGKCVDATGNCSTVPVYFDFNEYTLSSGAQNGISASAKCLKEQKVTTVTIEGHCDERGTDAYNMELGGRRAKVVKEYMQKLLPKTKVKTISYGKAKPICSDDGEQCWGKTAAQK